MSDRGDASARGGGWPSGLPPYQIPSAPDPEDPDQEFHPQSSSSTFIDSCAECERNPVELYCTVCRMRFCRPCSDLVHRPKSLANHPREPIDEYDDAIRQVSKALDDEECLIREAQNASGSRFIYCNDVTLQLLRGEAFYSIMADATEAPPMVSVVGNSGVGKSSLLKSLVSPRSCFHPLSSAPDSNNSCTFDIHAFEGENGWLIIDSEGIGGSEKPSSTPPSSRTSNSHNSHSSQEYDHPLSLQATSSSSITLPATLSASSSVAAPSVPHTPSRSEFVHKAYPRLLYPFSKVICFVFNDHKATKLQCQLLIDFATSGHPRSFLSSTNKPAVIIIFNRQLRLPEDLWAPEKALQDWEKRVEKEDLDAIRSLYRSVSTVYIPAVSDRGCYEEARRFLAQKEVLRTLIYQQMASSVPSPLLPPTTTSSNKMLPFELMHRAIMRLNRDVDAPLDFNALLPPDNSRFEANEMTEYLVYFYKDILEAYKQQKREQQIPEERWKSTWQTFLNFIQFVFMPAHRLEMTWNNNIPEPLRSILENVERQVCAKWAPCLRYELKGTQLHHCSRYASSTLCRLSSHEGVPRGSTKTFQWISSPDGGSVPAKLDFCNELKSRLKAPLTMDQYAPYLEILQYIRSPARYCIGCFQSDCSFPQKCQHNFCSTCLHRYQHQCPICPTHPVYNTPVIPPLAGVRILSLDGGGVRGIVSLEALQRFEELCYGIPTVKLFDLITGTSTGAIIATGLVVGQKKTEELNKLYESLSSRVFTRSARYGIVWMSRYDAGILDEELKKVVGAKELRSVPNAPAICIVSCEETKSAEKYQPHLLTSYVTVPKVETSWSGIQGRPEVQQVLASDAMLASSSAPSYFDPFTRFENRVLLDGGIIANCPAVIALEEARKLWPGHPRDSLVSFGTGRQASLSSSPSSSLSSPSRSSSTASSSSSSSSSILASSSSPASTSASSPPSPSSSILPLVDFVKNSIELLTRSCRLWDHAKDSKWAPPGPHCHRIDPTLTRVCELDNYKAIGRLKEETRGAMKQEEALYVGLRNLARHSIATLFYVDHSSLKITLQRGDGGASGEVVEIEGVICSRIELPPTLKYQMISKSTSQLFQAYYVPSALQSSFVLPMSCVRFWQQPPRQGQAAGPGEAVISFRLEIPTSPQILASLHTLSFGFSCLIDHAQHPSHPQVPLHFITPFPISGCPIQLDLQPGDNFVVHGRPNLGLP